LPDRCISSHGLHQRGDGRHVATAVTKVLNLFSSLVATAVFAARGLIDWKLGLVLGAASFGGAAVARNLSNRLLRRVFLVAVLTLAVKTLLYDVSW
jgi:uncharacterized protein